MHYSNFMVGQEMTFLHFVDASGGALREMAVSGLRDCMRVCLHFISWQDGRAQAHLLANETVCCSQGNNPFAHSAAPCASCRRWDQGSRVADAELSIALYAPLWT